MEICLGAFHLLARIHHISGKKIYNFLPLCQAVVVWYKDHQTDKCGEDQMGGLTYLGCCDEFLFFCSLFIHFSFPHSARKRNKFLIGQNVKSYKYPLLCTDGIFEPREPRNSTRSLWEVSVQYFAKYNGDLAIYDIIYLLPWALWLYKQFLSMLFVEWCWDAVVALCAVQ